MKSTRLLTACVAGMLAVSCFSVCASATPRRMIQRTRLGSYTLGLAGQAAYANENGKDWLLLESSNCAGVKFGVTAHETLLPSLLAAVESVVGAQGYQYFGDDAYTDGYMPEIQYYQFKACGGFDDDCFYDTAQALFEAVSAEFEIGDFRYFADCGKVTYALDKGYMLDDLDSPVYEKLPQILDYLEEYAPGFSLDSDGKLTSETEKSAAEYAAVYRALEERFAVQPTFARYSTQEFGGWQFDEDFRAHYNTYNSITEEQIEAVRAAYGIGAHSAVQISVTETQMRTLADSIGYIGSGELPPSVMAEALKLGGAARLAADTPDSGNTEPVYAYRLVTDDPARVLCYLQMNGAEVGVRVIAASIPGDVNSDGRLTVSDAVLIARVAAEDPDTGISEAGIALADLNGDGTVSSADTVRLLRQLAGLPG